MALSLINLLLFVVICFNTVEGLLTARQRRATCKPAHDNLCANAPAPGQKVAPGKKVLITGLGASGTHSLALLFSMNGIELSHESVAKNRKSNVGSVSWPYAVDVQTKHRAPAWPNAWTSFFDMHPECKDWRQPWLKPPNVRFDHVYHIARCPLDVVAALTSHGNCSLAYYRDTLGWHLDGNDNLKSAEYLMTAWLRWNEHLESYADERFRIDDFKNVFVKVCKDQGLKHETECDNAQLPIRTHDNENHRPHGFFTWEDCKKENATVTEQVIAKAREYGFAESCFGEQNNRLLYLGVDEVATLGIPFGESVCTRDTSDDCDDDMFWVWDAKTARQLFPERHVFSTVKAALSHAEARRATPIIED